MVVFALFPFLELMNIWKAMPRISLYRMAAFIRQQKPEDKTVKDIPQIAEFGFTTWNFISSIYESR